MKMDSGMLALGGASNEGLWPNDLMGNADLTWETTKSFNVGLDFGLWNNRLTGNIMSISQRQKNRPDAL